MGDKQTGRQYNRDFGMVVRELRIVVYAPESTLGQYIRLSCLPKIIHDLASKGNAQFIIATNHRSKIL